MTKQTEQKTCSACGRVRPIVYRPKNYCQTCYKRLIWRPRGGASVENERKANRRYKASNRSILRDTERQYRKEHRGVCSNCGGPTSERNRIGLCRKCMHEEHLERWKLIEGLWHDGKTLDEIAQQLSVSPKTVAFEVSTMRKAGIKMPYRRQRKVAAAT